MEAVGGAPHAGAHGFGQGGGQDGVDLDRAHPRSRFEEGEGEGAEAGADFDDLVPFAHSGGRDDAAHGPGVVDEVLAEGLGGADAQGAADGAHFHGPQQSGVRGLGAVRQGGVGAAAGWPAPARGGRGAGALRRRGSVGGHGEESSGRSPYQYQPTALEWAHAEHGVP